MKTMFIRPTKGRKVRFEVGNAPMPDEGARVPESQHYLRRLRDGDAEICREPAEPAQPIEPKAVVRPARRKQEE